VSLDATGFELPAHLRADCARCCGLCCVVHPFDADQGFGFDKPAAEPCRHLQADHRCAIHTELTARGFPGCVSFDCYGAGQRVTQRFAGHGWRDSPELAARMFSAYERQRALHEMQAMVHLALSRADSRSSQSLQELLARLEHLCEIDEAVDAATLRRQVQQQVRAALSPPGSP
jgi:hypothetical protein